MKNIEIIKDNRERLEYKSNAIGIAIYRLYFWVDMKMVFGGYKEGVLKANKPDLL